MPGALAIDLRASQTILRFSMMPLGVVERTALERDLLSRLVFLVLPLSKPFTCYAKLVVAQGTLARGLLAVGRDARAIGFSLVRFELGTLATRQRIALAFFGDRHLAANLLDALALRRHEAQ